jgi:hypothetical protein
MHTGSEFPNAVLATQAQGPARAGVIFNEVELGESRAGVMHEIAAKLEDIANRLAPPTPRETSATDDSKAHLGHLYARLQEASGKQSDALSRLAAAAERLDELIA